MLAQLRRDSDFAGSPDWHLNLGQDFEILHHWQIGEIGDEAAEPNMLLPSGEQHSIGGGLQSLTALLVDFCVVHLVNEQVGFLIWYYDAA